MEIHAMAEMPVDAIAGEVPAQDAPEEIQEQILSEESSTEEQGEAEEPTKKVGGVAKRINELTANWREEQRRAHKLEEMLERVLTKDTKPAEPEAQKVTGEPALEQFKTYEEYVAAVADYRVEQKLAKIEADRAAAEAQKQKATVETTFQRKAEEFASSRPDFEEVAYNPLLPVTDMMADALNYVENGPQALYYLGKNPEQARRIASLTDPVAVAIEIGKIEYQLGLPQPRKITNAPPPIAPLSGGQGSGSIDPDKLTASEWRQWREQQLRK